LKGTYRDLAGNVPTGSRWLIERLFPFVGSPLSISP